MISGENMALDVSIVIVSWNTRDILRECLRSIYGAAGEVAFEIILVDNNSADGSADMAAEEFPEVRLIRNAENRGFAAGNNQGIAVARGRYVLLLNSDTVVLDGAIASAVRFADAHPRAAIVGCHTRGPTGNLQYNCYRFPSLLNLGLSLSRLHSTLWKYPFFGRSRYANWDYSGVREVDAVAGCFMLARKAAIDQVGPMCEDYFMYSEDTDWCWRFNQAGWKIMYTSDATIRHLGGCSSSQAATDMHLLERRSLLMFLERKSGKLARWTANLMFCVASLLRLSIVGARRIFGGQAGEAAKRQWAISLAALRFHALGRLPGPDRSPVR